MWEIFRHELFTGRNVPGGYPRELSAMGAWIPMREGVSSLRVAAVIRAADVNTQTHTQIESSGGTTTGRVRAGRSTALAQALAPPCLALRIALLR